MSFEYYYDRLVERGVEMKHGNVATISRSVQREDVKKKNKIKKWKKTGRRVGDLRFRVNTKPISLSRSRARLFDNMTYASVSSRVVDHIKAYRALNFHTCAQVPPRAYTCSADTTLNIGVNTLRRTRRRLLERTVRPRVSYARVLHARADFPVPKTSD